MRYLILSDIHSNLEALEAVLTDSAGLYQQVVCLGDIVGYGANPNEVTAWVRQNCEAVIRGNHDRACTGMSDLRFFNPVAKAAAEWTRTKLEPDHLIYLSGLPRGPFDVADCRLVHGSPLDEDTYVISIPDAEEQLQSLERGLIFFGHTHIQGGFGRRGSGDEVEGLSPYELVIAAEEDALLVNPGSVGQPRDNDWHAAYAIYDAGTRQIEFRRCPYDVDAAQRKIVEAGLPLALAERLGLGL
ncbi:MAG: metallophosphoesterase family protein [Acidobacteria bacterium]|nr:metallophosphoesterase family protein [Acidobacteriota bacterium]MDA1234640.1 metallophosphoesterase family protein [Acidobacteriota bacterium]